MKTVNEISSAQIEIKKSNFISFLVPISEFNKTHEHLKTEHPKAVHIVWAKRELNKYNQIVENQSDDGEPKGTSGPPALNALRGADIINAGVFIVRYFGGIKLGTGGLVRAYGGATNEAINSANLILFLQKDACIFYTPFALISRFEHFFNTHDITSFEREFNESGAVWTAMLKHDECVKLHDFSHVFEMDGFRLLAVPLSMRDTNTQN